ncbi:hypothetical protein ACIQVA_35090 [Streptomyces microflavus]|uniref:hypothetical protein n=1 Tax=Streptomyces microflavus TaxID=1919 RepID=UPI0037F607B7
MLAHDALDRDERANAAVPSPALQQFFGQVTEESLKIDAVEAVADLGAGHRRDEPIRSAVMAWLRTRLDDAAAGVRLGAALGMMARVDADERDALLEVVVDSIRRSAPTVDGAVWLSGKGSAGLPTVGSPCLAGDWPSVTRPRL